jgi:hypothetical protein
VPVATISARSDTWEQRPAVAGVSAAQQVALQTTPVLPRLQPISSVLAKQLQREQQQRKRLCKQLRSLERQLQHAGSNSTNSLDWLGVQVVAAEPDSDDPLFSSSTPPSVQQLQRLLAHRRSQLLNATSSSISDVTRGESLADQTADACCWSHESHTPRAWGMLRRKSSSLVFSMNWFRPPNSL